MRRSINTIPKDEYDILLRKAVHRMVKKFRILSDEENSKMIKADNQGNYEKLRSMISIHVLYHLWQTCFTHTMI